MVESARFKVSSFSEDLFFPPESQDTTLLELRGRSIFYLNEHRVTYNNIHIQLLRITKHGEDRQVK